jgi:TolB-like protein
MIKKYMLFSIAISLFTSCTTNNNNINKNYTSSNSSFFFPNYYSDINKAIIEISNQLLLNIPNRYKKNNKFVITTFVDLNNFDKTSKFARIISESLIDEMHKRRFNIIDYRTQQAISIDNKGEFILTRDVRNIRDEIPESLLLVGTYTKLSPKKVLVNARIINNFTSSVLSTAKIIYKFNNCLSIGLCDHIPEPIKISDDI